MVYAKHFFACLTNFMLTGFQFISCSIPTFQAEMAMEDDQRGPDVAVTCVFLVSGAAIAYWIDFGFTRLENQISWVRQASESSHVAVRLVSPVQLTISRDSPLHCRSCLPFVLVVSPFYFRILQDGTMPKATKQRAMRLSVEFSIPILLTTESSK